MSKSLVNRMLHLTSEDMYNPAGQGAESRRNQKRKSDVRHRKQSRQRCGGNQEVLGKMASERDIMAWHVASILNFDEAMENPSLSSVSTTKKNYAMDTLRRIGREHSSAAKRQRVSSQIIIGNSRASSTQYQQPTQATLNKNIPTFNKKQHQEEQEVKRLRQIAKLLQKRSTKGRRK